MEVLLVHFTLEGMTEAEYYRIADQEAQSYADVPGLISKVWLADPPTNTYGGVLTFRDAASLDAFLASDGFKGMQEAPVFSGVTARRFGVLEAPTRVTRGLATTAA